jgi:ABC-2 type transport system permease protein
VQLRIVENPSADEQDLTAREQQMTLQLASEASLAATRQREQSVLEQLLSRVAGQGHDDAQDLYRQFQRAVDRSETGTLPALQFRQIPVGQAEPERPLTRAEHNVPAYTIFGMFFIVQVVATSMLRERENGTFQRLSTAPLSRPVLLVGKLLPFYAINVAQVAVLFVCGHLFFHLRVGGSLAALAVITLAVSAAANALGLSIAALCKTQEQMGPLSTLILLTLAATGGLFIPVSDFPRLLRVLSWANVDSWALQGFQKVLVHSCGLAAILPLAAVLSGFALANYLFGIWKFRYE